MANMSLKKNPEPAQEPEVRCKNFLEVALGYSEETAIDEAKRCLGCKHKPCVAGCPVGAGRIGIGQYRFNDHFQMESHSVVWLDHRSCRSDRVAAHRYLRPE